MKDENYKDDVEPLVAFDNCLDDLIKRPPYSADDMVRLLARGAFIVEGKKSNWQTADTFAGYHSDKPEVLEALDQVMRQQEDLAIGDLVY